MRIPAPRKLGICGIPPPLSSNPPLGVVGMFFLRYAAKGRRFLLILY